LNNDSFIKLTQNMEYNLLSLEIEEKNDLKGVDWLEFVHIELNDADSDIFSSRYCDLIVAVAREQTRRYGHEWALEESEKKGIEKGKIESIVRLMLKFPDWSDEQIYSVLDVPIDMVKQARFNNYNDILK
jgi:hypothetical protein